MDHLIIRLNCTHITLWLMYMQRTVLIINVHMNIISYGFNYWSWRLAGCLIILPRRIASCRVGWRLVASCYVLSYSACITVSCNGKSCLGVSCRVLSHPTEPFRYLSCPVMSSLALSWAVPSRHLWPPPLRSWYAILRLGVYCHALSGPVASA